MLWFIIAAAASVILFTTLWSDPYGGVEFAFIGTGIAVLLAFMLNAGFAINYDDEYQSKPHKIANLQDGSKTSGSFFLGIGGFGEDMKYSFYGETSEGVYELKTVDNEDAKVSFTDKEPYYTYTCYRGVNSMLSMFSDGWCDEDEVTFHVPEGSIKTQFKLDAK